jgi:hypothetical protein
MSFNSRQEIEAGSALLDEKASGWIERINLELLDLSNTCDCVVGQLFPNISYLNALEVLFGKDSDENDVVAMSRGCGFSIDCYGLSFQKRDALYSQLTQEWKEYIRERIG